MIHLPSQPHRDVRRAELAGPAKPFTGDAYERCEECPADREPVAREQRIQAIIRRVHGELKRLARQRTMVRRPG